MPGALLVITGIPITVVGSLILIGVWLERHRDRAFWGKLVYFPSPLASPIVQPQVRSRRRGRPRLFVLPPPD